MCGPCKNDAARKVVRRKTAPASMALEALVLTFVVMVYFPPGLLVLGVARGVHSLVLYSRTEENRGKWMAVAALVVASFRVVAEIWLRRPPSR